MVMQSPSPNLGTLLESSLILYLASIVAGIASRSSRTGASISFGIAAAASLCSLPIPFVYGFSGAKPVDLELWVLGTEIPIHVDALSAVLIFVVSVLTLASALYSFNYIDHYREIGMFGYFAALFSLFSVSMMLVSIVNSALWFLFMWEVMTLASYFLINWEHTKESVRKAAWKYFVTMHFLSTLPLVIAIALLVSLTGHDVLTAMQNSVQKLSTPIIALLQSLFIIGFGSKAGIVPMHFWLPDAHPAAPSNVSALLSGAMIKVAVYGLIRFCAFVLPPSYALGMIIAVMGALSLTVGTLMALRQTDAKRLLAYHSIGQMGYIWLGVGAGIALASINSSLAVVGFVAGLYHLVNHAVFKGLLFLSSGSMIYRAHTTDLNAMGGLSKYMPYTAALTLIAALSIAGIPPMNGFVSKWLIYESTFLSGNGILVFCGIMALFISAATLASFIKFYTSAFEGTPRAEITEGEVPSLMLAGKSILAALCIVMGVLPITIVNLLTKAFSVVFPWISPARFVVTPLFVTISGVTGYAPLILVAAMSAFLGLGLAIGVPRAKPASVWACGSEVETKQYKMIALHYYRAYEEYIHALYHVSHELYEGLGQALRATSRGLASFSNRIAIGLTSAFSRFVRSVGTYIANNVREVYIDEAVTWPVTKAIIAISRLASRIVAKTDIDTFLVYSSLLVLALSIVVITFALGG